MLSATWPVPGILGADRRLTDSIMSLLPMCFMRKIMFRIIGTFTHLYSPKFICRFIYVVFMTTTVIVVVPKVVGAQTQT